jgi:hypothetical protein
MTENINLVRTMDARVWAAEFMRITGGTVDEQTMISWFANAIMCGWDHHYWESDEYKQMMARVLLSTEPTSEGD